MKPISDTNYWRLQEDYSRQDIEQMTKANLNDLLVEINLALEDKVLPIRQANKLLLMIALELNRR